MNKWPSSLPCPLISTVQYAPRDNVIRSEFPGSIKRRRQFTASYTDVTFRLRLSRAQCQILDDFYNITTEQVLPFEWVELRDPAHRLAVYAFNAPPTYQDAGAGGARMWDVDISLELRTPFNGQFFLTNEINSVLTTDNDEGLTT